MLFFPAVYSLVPGSKILRAIAALLMLVLLDACSIAPRGHSRNHSIALQNTQSTHLGRHSLLWRQGQANQNGVYSLAQGQDAFGARLALMDLAEKSIDAQYFLMKPDDAGLVFSAKLLEAADRGVRVRLLLDDIFTTVDDRFFSAMNTHSNVEIRIFNPIARRGLWVLNYLAHFKQTNRRMHNKAFVVDNQVAIVGGRNIAAEYFQLETSGEFIDFDMLSTGPIVPQISDAFDRYWNHPLALPVEAFIAPPAADEVSSEQARIERGMREAGDTIYAEAVNTTLLKRFSQGETRPFVAPMRLLVDEPEKLEQAIGEGQVVAAELAQELRQAKQEIIIFTPYLIPGETGMAFLEELAAQGKKLVIVTNSLASNNHTAAFSAYSRYRKRILQAGIELWEACPDVVDLKNAQGSTLKQPLTLHAKGILIDQEKAFVGSLNLDPRAIDINTEMGLLIHSPELVTQMTQLAQQVIPQIAYRLSLDEQQQLQWQASINDEKHHFRTDPKTSFLRRLWAKLLRIAPEKQL